MKQILIILAIGFLVYANILPNQFVWDDEEQIVKNPLVQNLSNLPFIFKSSTFYSGGGTPTGWFYRPMMTLSYLLNYWAWGGKPFGFHLFQIIIHLLNSVLIFLIFSKIFSREKISNSRLISFLMALIFAVHPANVEAVSYIAALQESLYTLFGLLALFILTRVKDFKLKNYFLLGILVLLSLLSKESAVFIIPLIFVFLILYQKEKVGYWFASSAMAFFGYLFLRLGVAKIPLFAPNIGPVAESSFIQRLITIPYEIVSYLRIIFFPKDLFISQHTLITKVSDFRFWGYLLLILPVVVFFTWFGIKRRSKLFAFFAFWFVGSLGLVLNIIPLDMIVAERWLYFPLIGFLGMMGIILGEVIRAFPKVFLSNLFLFCLVVLFSCLSLRTIIRNSNWNNGLTLFGHDILLNPDAFDLQNNYGVELFRAGRLEEAKIHFERSIELYPRWWFAYNNLGAVYERKGDLAQARKLYEQTIKISDYYLAYENLAFLMLKTEDLGETIEFIEGALKKLPLNIKLRAALVVAYYRHNNYDQALFEAKKLFQLSPTPGNSQLLQTIIRREKI